MQVQPIKNILYFVLFLHIPCTGGDMFVVVINANDIYEGPLIYASQMISLFYYLPQ